MPKIIIDFIPHKKQRYDTVGDYLEKKGETHFRISKMNPDHQFLILMHELTEWYLTKKKGISLEKIDQFDMEYEKNRKEGDESEPGDDLRAPYYHEHQIATKIEKDLAGFLGVDWDKYDEYVRNL